MRRNKLAIIAPVFLVLFSCFSLQAQSSKWSLQATAGYGQFETIDDFRKEIWSRDGFETSSSNSNVTEPIRSFQLGLGLNYNLNTRWTASLHTSFMGWRGELGEDRLVIFGEGTADEARYNLRSDREFYAAQASLLAFFHFMPNAPLDISLGAGPALIARQHYYETLAQYDIVNDRELRQVGNTYERKNRTDTGVAASFRLSAPVASKLNIGLQADFTLFTSEDHRRSLAVLMEYRL